MPKLKYADIYMLSRKEFIEKGLRTPYEFQEFSRLLCHIAFENHDYSKMLARRSLVGLNKASADEC